MTAPWLLLAALLPGFTPYHTSTGATAHWDTATFCYEMSDALPPAVDLDRVEGLLSTAIRTWADLACAPKEVRYQGRTPKTHVDPAEGSGNTVVWITDPADWTHVPGYYALTTVTVQRADGVVLDADLEVNWGRHAFWWADNTCPTDRIDLWNTLTHESGHLMGLDHSDVPGATMGPSAGFGDCYMRDLAEDDVDGYCWLAANFPPTEKVVPCRAEPTDAEAAPEVDEPGPDRVEAEADATVEAEGGGGGGCAEGQGTPRSALTVIGLAIVALALRRAASRTRP